MRLLFIVGWIQLLRMLLARPSESAKIGFLLVIFYQYFLTASYTILAYGGCDDRKERRVPHYSSVITVIGVFRFHYLYTTAIRAASLASWFVLFCFIVIRCRIR